ncbi:hypothetical protein QVD17_00230 [Tagetes erecta]|uniref:HAT C-terminal dimerisation domain-containing protein n=1 Tax=Tagetes erecta TaxID=13708 RepID=A0AAD8L9T1_TARER|nr:hypothetical protein QVD17_00230 [Tagetes erecta]
MAMGSSEIFSSRNELDKYLGEEREPKDPYFVILQWWKLNQCRYPDFAKIARDILTIPVSAIASESSFSTGGRVLDSFRMSLTPKMVEALVCAQDWLRDSNCIIMIDDTILEMNMEEAGLRPRFCCYLTKPNIIFYLLLSLITPLLSPFISRII